MWRKIKANLRKFFRKLGSVGDFLSSWSVFFGIVVLFVGTLFLITLTLTQITISFTENPFGKKLTDALLLSVGMPITNIDKNEYTMALTSAIGSFAVLVSLWFSGVASLSFFRHKRQLSKQSSVRKKVIREDGVDDLHIMRTFYEQAHKVVVFSGSFDWIQSDPDLYSEINRLVEKSNITFVSYKTKNEVEEAIGDNDVFSKLENNFRFESGKKMQCSLIQRGSSQIILYKVDNSLIGEENNVVIIYGKQHTKYLLEILNHLSRDYYS